MASNILVTYEQTVYLMAINPAHKLAQVISVPEGFA